MLRWLVIALLAANLAFFGWTQGWLDSVVGVRATGDREPGRLAQQVRPDSVVILTPQAAAAAASAASLAAVSGASSTAEAAVGSACLQAGPFGDPELATAETTLAALMSVGTWSRMAVVVPGVWVVYMGPYRSADMRRKKEAEVRRRGLKYEAFKLPPELPPEQRRTVAAQLIPGISLGRYESLNAADAALAEFGVSGIQSARVVEVHPSYAVQNLRVAKADAALALRLKGLGAKATSGKPFAACPTP